MTKAPSFTCKLYAKFGTPGMISVLQTSKPSGIGGSSRTDTIWASSASSIYQSTLHSISPNYSCQATTGK